MHRNIYIDLRALMSERDSAHDTWLCLRTPEARAEFVELRNRLKNRLTAARRQFLCGELTSGDRIHSRISGLA